MEGCNNSKATNGTDFRNALKSVDEQLFHARTILRAIEQDADDPVGLAGAALKFLEEASDTVERLSKGAQS